MLGYTSLEPCPSATVLARAQTGVAAHLAAIDEAMPVPNLAIDDHTRHEPQSAWLPRRGRGLSCTVRAADLLFHAQQNRLAVVEQLFHPLRHFQRGKGASLPPA